MAFTNQCRRAYGLARSFVVGLLLASLLSKAATCVGEIRPNVLIQTKRLSEDVEIKRASISVKVTIANSPESGIAHFNVQGLGSADIVLAEFFMHATQIKKGAPSVCTKRFELSSKDLARIEKWQLANVTRPDVSGIWRMDSMAVGTLPGSNVLSFRANCSRIGKPISDCVAVQGLDDEGFEQCHYLFDRSGVLANRLGRWQDDGGTLQFTALRSDLRLSDIEGLKIWRALPTAEKSSQYKIWPWDGDQPLRVD
jgi:hypothetical protein